MDHADLLRRRDEESAGVTSIELFFDLVYVLAITQITQLLVGHLSLPEAGRAFVLLLAIWAGWNYTSWFTNYFNPEALQIRAVLIGLMLASLVMSASLPNAFSGWGLTFAIAYVALNLGRTTFALISLKSDSPLTGVFQRPLVWWSVTGALWIAGGFAHDQGRIWLWVFAAVIEYSGVWLGYPIPRLGRSHTVDYTIAGGHMAERCQLFILLALGESILGTGVHFGELPRSGETIASFIAAFVGSVALWWIYFDQGAEAGRQRIAASKDPGRLGIVAYTFFHIPMVGGIIAFAAAADLAIPHPSSPATTATAAVILAGPGLYLIGHALFKWALWQRLAWSHLIGVLALVAAIPVALVTSRLDLLIVTVCVSAAVALWDTLQRVRTSDQTK
jgi:low temperature requirement protein LtrA